MIGEVVGNFRLLSRLGRGGMGEVYLGEHTKQHNRVAIKLLHADISRDTNHVQRFFNESSIVGRIKHNGIVKIFDSGHHGENAYLIMELLEGESLAKRLEGGRRLPPKVVADLGRQIASVLEATHKAGITHRDLKPDNIFLVPDDERASGERVKILDFGIAKLSGTLAGSSPKTQGTMGTPPYMAPEQWGDSAKVDWRADVYSLGCVAFEMACGRVPFPAANFAEAYVKHLQEPPPSARLLAPEMPEAFDELIFALLAKKPDDRPPSMGAIIAMFESLTRGAADNLAASISSLPRASSPVVLAVTAHDTSDVLSVPGRPVSSADSAAALAVTAMPAPAHPTPVPRTTMRESLGEITHAPKRKRPVGLIALASSAVVAAVAAVVIIATRHDDSDNGNHAPGVSMPTSAAPMATGRANAIGPSDTGGTVPGGASMGSAASTATGATTGSGASMAPTGANNTATSGTTPSGTTPSGTNPGGTNATENHRDANDSKHAATDPKHTATDSKHAPTDPKHAAVDPKHTATDSKHAATDAKSDPKHAADPKHDPKLDPGAGSAAAAVHTVDSDGDGVPDTEDNCPRQPGPAALHGCPDSDGDGIPDIEDDCRTVAGPASNHGCPVKAPDKPDDKKPDDKKPDDKGGRDKALDGRT